MKHEGYSSISESRLTSTILVCSPCDAIDNAGSEEGTVTSPLRCLDAACDGTYSHICIFFPRNTFRETDELIELCESLKHNSRTKGTPIVAILRDRHEGLMTILRKTGVEYMKILGGGRLERGSLRRTVSELGPDNNLAGLTAPFCPFLHYSRVNESLDMPVCGGYHDILVINDRRLRGLCATGLHEDCEYFKNPRKNS